MLNIFCSRMCTLNLLWWRSALETSLNFCMATQCCAAFPMKWIDLEQSDGDDQQQQQQQRQPNNQPQVWHNHRAILTLVRHSFFPVSFFVLIQQRITWVHQPTSNSTSQQITKQPNPNDVFIVNYKNEFNFYFSSINFFFIPYTIFLSLFLSLSRISFISLLHDVDLVSIAVNAV